MPQVCKNCFNRKQIKCVFILIWIWINKYKQVSLSFSTNDSSSLKDPAFRDCMLRH